MFVQDFFVIVAAFLVIDCYGLQTPNMNKDNPNDTSGGVTQVSGQKNSGSHDEEGHIPQITYVKASQTNSYGGGSSQGYSSRQGGDDAAGKTTGPQKDVGQRSGRDGPPSPNAGSESKNQPDSNGPLSIDCNQCPIYNSLSSPSGSCGYQNCVCGNQLGNIICNGFGTGIYYALPAGSCGHSSSNCGCQNYFSGNQLANAVYGGFGTGSPYALLGASCGYPSSNCGYQNYFSANRLANVIYGGFGNESPYAALGGNYHTWYGNQNYVNENRLDNSMFGGFDTGNRYA